MPFFDFQPPINYSDNYNDHLVALEKARQEALPVLPPVNNELELYVVQESLLRVCGILIRLKCR